MVTINKCLKNVGEGKEKKGHLPSPHLLLVGKQTNSYCVGNGLEISLQVNKELHITHYFTPQHIYPENLQSMFTAALFTVTKK